MKVSLNSLILLFIAICVIWLSIYGTHKTAIDKAVADNTVAKTAVEILTAVAQAAVHETESIDAGGDAKKAQAVDAVKESLKTLGVNGVSDTTISGAVEQAVSAMHLAYKATNSVTLPAPSAKSLSVDTKIVDKDPKTAADTITAAIEKSVAGGGPMDESK